MSMQQTPDEIFDEASGDLAIGDLESAVAKYRRCVEIAPDFFDGWHALGMALMKLARFVRIVLIAPCLARQENHGSRVQPQSRLQTRFKFLSHICLFAIGKIWQ